MSILMGCLSYYLFFVQPAEMGSKSKRMPDDRFEVRLNSQDRRGQLERGTLERQDSKSVGEKLNYYADCAKGMDCSFSGKGDRIYSVELDLQIANFLRELASKIQSNDENFIREALPGLRRLMIEGSAFVQRETLQLFAQLPVSKENLLAIEKGLLATADVDLFREGISELKRYKGTEFEPILGRFVVTRLERGGTMVGREMAKEIFDFLNPEIAPEVERVMAGLQLRSKAREYLRYNLEEYHRLNASEQN